MKRKIGIIKLGQKIYFNRDNKEVIRDNSNGGYELYSTLKLLFENNTLIQFYVLSNNDISKSNSEDNVINAYNNEFTKEQLNTVIVFAGLKDYENDEYSTVLFNKINTSNKFILISHDPRCLKSTLTDERLIKKPDTILSQFKGDITYNNIIYKVEYIPLETASAYQHKRDYSKDEFYNKKNTLIVIANSSDKKYNRIKKISKLLRKFNKIDIYGKIFEDEFHLLNKQNYKGSVIYDKIPKILNSSQFTLIVPIDKDMITSKYIESLMYNCLPIFYKEYNLSLLNVSSETKSILRFLTIKSAEELYDLLVYSSRDISHLEYMHNKLYKELVEPYIDGKILSREIIRRLL